MPQAQAQTQQQTTNQGAQRRQQNRRQRPNRPNRNNGRGRFVRPMPRQTGGVQEQITLTTRESNIIWGANAESIRSDCANLQLRLAAVMPVAEYAALEDVIHNDLVKLKEQAQAQFDSINKQTKGKKLAPISFEGAREITVARNSPLFKEFVEGVRTLDKVFTMIEALWLDGSFSSAKRSELIQNWMSAYGDVSRKIQQLIGQAINQAARERLERRRERDRRAEERNRRRAERRAQRNQQGAQGAVAEGGEGEQAPTEKAEDQEPQEVQATEAVAETPAVEESSEDKQE